MSERVSADVETPPAVKAFSFNSFPSEESLNDVAERARRVLRVEREHRRHPERPAPRREKWDTEALERYKGDWGWWWRALNAGVPRRFWLSDLYTGLQTPAVLAARQFCEGADEEGESELEEAGCLGLLGPVGVGKTVAAVGVLRVSDEDIRFFDVRDLSRRLMNPLQREEALEQALSTFTIVLDDLGAAYVRADSFLDGLMEQIFIHREARDCVTVFTSNLTRRQLEDAVGLRVADRLAGPWGSIHELPGVSLRRQRP